MAGMALLAALPAQLIVLHPPLPRERGLWLRIAACYAIVVAMAGLITAAAL